MATESFLEMIRASDQDRTDLNFDDPEIQLLV